MSAGLMERVVCAAAVMLVALSPAHAESLSGIFQKALKPQPVPQEGPERHYNKYQMAVRLKQFTPHLGDWEVQDSAMRDYFEIFPPNGNPRMPCLIHQSLQYLTCGKGWERLGPAGRYGNLDPISDQSYRLTVLKAMQPDNGIRFQFGNGRRQIILLSAYDCPSCRALEQNIQKLASSLDATIYVFPWTLRLADPQARQRVTDIWCRSDPNEAWRSMVLGTAQVSAIRTPNCGLHTVETSLGVGAAFGIHTVPTLIMESGDVVFNAATMPLQDLATLLGS